VGEAGQSRLLDARVLLVGACLVSYLSFAQLDFSWDKVLAAANVIAALANSGMDSLFSPETANGRGWKDTLVKPEYFYSADEVKRITDQFKMQANAMVIIAKTGKTDMIKAQFADVLDACKACHKKFRHKK